MDNSPKNWFWLIRFETLGSIATVPLYTSPSCIVPIE